MKTIRFYSSNEPYGQFSNFAPYPIEVDHRVWPTVEHYYQAQKYPGTTEQELIRRAETPKAAATLGRGLAHLYRADWDSLKESVMLEGLRAKFSQHGPLRAELLATGDALLVEHTARDDFWGDGGDGSGANRLGILLMRIREELAGSTDDGTTGPHGRR